MRKDLKASSLALAVAIGHTAVVEVLLSSLSSSLDVAAAAVNSKVDGHPLLT
jgi:hypothetical protein